MTGDEQKQPQKPLSGFEGLSGIEPPKDIHVSFKTNLEKLLEVEERVIKNVSEQEITDYKCRFAKKGSNPDDTLVYDDFFKRLKSQELKDVDFNAEDLQGFVLAKSSVESNYGHVKQTLLGLYTGCLLHILTERNRNAGKRTKIHLKGNGNRFDYLFYCAREVDELVIDGFGGDYVARLIGCNRGSVGTLVVLNHQGGTDLAALAAYNQGSVDNLIIMDSKGNNAGIGCGWNQGRIGNMVIMDHEGASTATRIATNQGHVDNLIIINNTGIQVANNCGEKNGSIRDLIILNNNGDNIGQSCSNIERLFIKGNKGRYGFTGCHDITTFCVIDNEGEHMEINCYGPKRIGTFVLVNNNGFSYFPHIPPNETIFINNSIIPPLRRGFRASSYIKQVESENTFARFFYYNEREEQGLLTSISYNIYFWLLAYVFKRDINMHKRLQRGNIALARYEELSQQQGIDERLKIAQSLQGKTYSEIIETLHTSELLKPTGE